MKILVLFGLALSVFVALGTAVYVSSVLSNTYRAMQGDTSAVGAIANDTANEVVGEVEWYAGMTVLIAILSALGVGGALIAILKRNR